MAGPDPIVLTLDGPGSVVAGRPETYGGRLALRGAVGLPLPQVDFVVDGAPVHQTATDPEGGYSAALTFSLGHHRVVAVAHRGTPAETRSPPLEVVAAVLTIHVEAGTARREPGRVTVVVALSGYATPDPATGSTTVRGELTVFASQPCWPDPATACVDIVSEQTLPWEATSTDGSFQAEAGPFHYSAQESPPAEEVCDQLGLHATARAFGLTIEAERQLVLCA
jgi:hypothetical protein